jgi:hypothetical protein
LLIIAGCAAVGESGQAELSRELANMTAGPAQSCAPSTQSQSLQAVDNRTLVLRTANTVWVSRLEGPCPGLTPMSTIIVESFNGQYCRGDHVSGLEPGSSIPGATCPLAEFVPYRAR